MSSTHLCVELQRINPKLTLELPPFGIHSKITILGSSISSLAFVKIEFICLETYNRDNIERLVASDLGDKASLSENVGVEIEYLQLILTIHKQTTHFINYIYLQFLHLLNFKIGHLQLLIIGLPGPTKFYPIQRISKLKTPFLLSIL